VSFSGVTTIHFFTIGVELALLRIFRFGVFQQTFSATPVSPVVDCEPKELTLEGPRAAASAAVVSVRRCVFGHSSWRSFFVPNNRPPLCNSKETTIRPGVVANHHFAGAGWYAKEDHRRTSKQESDCLGALCRATTANEHGIRRQISILRLSGESTRKCVDRCFFCRLRTLQ